MATQADRSAETIDRILTVATAQFAARGYHKTSVRSILDEAEVSRGAMYHHFSSKEAVFAHVCERAAREAVVRSVVPSGPGGRRAALADACMAWLNTVREPLFRTILLELDPTVLGWEQARSVEARFSLGLMVASLRSIATEDGADRDVVLAARLLNAAVAEIALVDKETPMSESIQRQAVVNVISAMTT